ncbi:hypothetical protein AB6N23_02700 [Cellulomonas sp. 179-A 9B4 NHS]|uniref:hypothetical protein n=1 Tax=Cellulomonas sp. 179-A 9B4 NHS TaxID=3142379 RepID=UPI0039A15FB5
MKWLGAALANRGVIAPLRAETSSAVPAVSERPFTPSAAHARAGAQPSEVPAELDAALIRAARALADLRARGGSGPDLAASLARVTDVQTQIERSLGIPPRVGHERRLAPRDGSPTSTPIVPSPRPSVEVAPARPTSAETADTQDLTERVVQCVQRFPGASAKEVAASLHRLVGRPVTRREVNAILYRDPRFIHDAGAPPRWQIRA